MASIVLLVLLAVLLQRVTIRWDMTGDQRYTLHPIAKQQIRGLQQPLTVTLYLDGNLNAGFRRLRDATLNTVGEMHHYQPQVHLNALDEEQMQRAWQQLYEQGFEPVLVHERQKKGHAEQNYLWPYARLEYNGRSTVIELLRQQRGLTAEENLNASIENIEYAFAEAIHTLQKDSVERVVFLEGHGETDESHVYDFSRALSRYFQVDRGALTTDNRALDPYAALIIADPQQAFSDTDKFLIDQYLMRGGKVLWLVNGVRFSGNMLSENGVTPIIANDLKINDLLFRYGVRINPALVQDLQCLRIPVDVSLNPQQPSYQPLPWTYAPLLLTSEASAITHNLMQVSATFASCIEPVGAEDGLKKEILLATSTASAITPTPAEVDLSDLTVEPERFTYAYLPVAYALEGSFPSLYAHRIPPEGIEGGTVTVEKSVSTRQVVVASGSVARNEWLQNQPLPAGYDRYTKTQFSNRDFLVNAVLWLTDDSQLITLRHRSVALRLINEKKATDQRTLIQTVSVVLPLLLLALVGGGVALWRRLKYTT